jgi:hypothetical protein
MISEEVLDRYRVEGTRVRVVRDAMEMNDVLGIVVAWDDETMMIRRPNRRIVKVSRAYRIGRADEPRETLLEL